MDAAYELHRQQLIKAYNSAVKKKDWQAARNYRDELNILIAKKVALSWEKENPAIALQKFFRFFRRLTLRYLSLSNSKFYYNTYKHKQ